MIDVPAYARHALARVQTLFPEAFIGGGYLRDLDNGVEPKDIDIFVLQRGDNTFDVVSVALASTHEGTDVTVSSKYDHQDIVGVYEFTSDDGVPLNIIACKGDEDAQAVFMGKQLSRFDLGICRIAFTGMTLMKTQAYVADKALRQLSILNPWNYERSVARARRIAQRYPGWRVFGHNGELLPDDFAFDVV